jgi:hypothetical protein
MQTIKIDPDGKYVLLIHGGVSLSHHETMRIQEALNIWWKGEEKFLVISPGSGCEVRIERVDDNLDSDSDNQAI